jgi:hypothetical protein
MHALKADARRTTEPSDRKRLRSSWRLSTVSLPSLSCGHGPTRRRPPKLSSGLRSVKTTLTPQSSVIRPSPLCETKRAGADRSDDHRHRGKPRAVANRRGARRALWTPAA